MSMLAFHMLLYERERPRWWSEQHSSAPVVDLRGGQLDESHWFYDIHFRADVS